MKQAQYRLGTMTFADDSCPTWGARSTQILEQMTRWERDGWQLSPLNASAHIRLQAQGFCIVLERPLQSPARVLPRNSGPRKRRLAA
jgi:hypothetical protein